MCVCCERILTQLSTKLRGDGGKLGGGTENSPLVKGEVTKIWKGMEINPIYRKER